MNNRFVLAGVVGGMLMLGGMIKEGRGVEADPAEAKQMFDAARKAAVSYAYVANRSSLSMKADARAATDYVFSHCAELVK